MRDSSFGKTIEQNYLQKVQFLIGNKPPISLVNGSAAAPPT